MLPALILLLKSGYCIQRRAQKAKAIKDRAGRADFTRLPVEGELALDILEYWIQHAVDQGSPTIHCRVRFDPGTLRASSCNAGHPGFARHVQHPGRRKE